MALTAAGDHSRSKVCPGRIVIGPSANCVQAICTVARVMFVTLSLFGILVGICVGRVVSISVNLLRLLRMISGASPFPPIIKACGSPRTRDHVVAGVELGGSSADAIASARP